MYAVFFHAHQKIDKISHKHLRSIADKPAYFPDLKHILHFEGHNGPDATKLKNKLDIEQPWHFINPFDIADTDLHKLIDGHYTELVKALRARDEIKAAFEAAWLAHALVDGLTPAHHYPYEEALELLRGDSRHTRKGLVGRAIVKGDNRRDSFRRSFQLIGPKGLLTNHAMFEGGAYTIMAPLKLTQARPDAEELALVREHGVVEMFQRLAKEIAAIDMYERYVKKGWTSKLMRDIRRDLAPRMVKMVTLAWYAAMHEAQVQTALEESV